MPRLREKPLAAGCDPAIAAGPPKRHERIDNKTAIAPAEPEKQATTTSSILAESILNLAARGEFAG
jgi:hypothetical protein